MSEATGPPAGFRAAVPGEVAVEPGELARAVEVARAACDAARREILPRFRNVAVETKGDGSPVTEADRQAERAIRAVLEDAFPEDAILGEEFGESGGAARRRWLIDPIDGTIAFTRGIPLFTTLVALCIDDEPVVGVIDLPALNDRIHGARDSGAWRGDTRLSVATDAHLEDALVCHGDLFCFEAAGLRPLHEALSRKARLLRGYTDAFGHLLVLSGAAEAMVDCDLNPWDVAATRLLATEAGAHCWLREREAGRKLDLVFGAAGVVQDIGRLLGD